MLTLDASTTPTIAELPLALLAEERTGPAISSAELAALAVTASPGPSTSALTFEMGVGVLRAILGAASACTATGAVQIIRRERAVPAHAGPSTLVLPTLAGSIDVPLRVPGGSPATQPQSSEKRARARAARAGIAPANELRALTGLSPQLLANLFGVSRTTYYKWIEGATPRDARYSHLLEVLSHVRGVSERLAGVADLAAWLRTPVSPGGRTPLDYLRDQRYAAFRGFALRSTSREMALDVPRPALREANLSAAERAAARRRINPAPRSPVAESRDEPEDD